MAKISNNCPKIQETILQAGFHCNKNKLTSYRKRLRFNIFKSRKNLQECFVFQSAISDSPGMSKALMEQKQKERKFLEQLLDGKKVENYTIPVPVNAELRKYQQVC